MKQFHSYGPVNEKYHFAVKRNEMISSCLKNLVGAPGEDGHFFTIWAPRQTGKTWLMRQVAKEIENRCPDRFLIIKMSCQGIVMNEDPPDTDFLTKIPKLMLDSLDMDVEAPLTWEEWALFFHKKKGQPGISNQERQGGSASEMRRKKRHHRSEKFQEQAGSRIGKNPGSQVCKKTGHEQRHCCNVYAGGR